MFLSNLILTFSYTFYKVFSLTTFFAIYNGLYGHILISCEIFNLWLMNLLVLSYIGKMYYYLYLLSFKTTASFQAPLFYRIPVLISFLLHDAQVC